jgi:hypothetical protein
MKQNGVFYLGTGLVFAWVEMKAQQRSLREVLFRYVQIAFGVAIPFSLLLAVLLMSGVFGNFVFWTVEYAKQYASEVPLSEAPFIFLKNLVDVTRATAAIWILGFIGVPLLKVPRWPERTRLILTWWFAISLLSICPGLYFRQHYFILLVPVLSLLVGVSVLSLEFLLTKWVSHRSARAAAVGVFVAAVAVYGVHEREYLLTMRGQDLTRIRYWDHPFVEAVGVGDYIRANTSASDTIGVLGSEPEIFFYAQRKSATGYLYVYGLMEEQKLAESMRQQMLQELTAAHPKYIVFVDVRTSWWVLSSNQIPLTSAARYLNACYEPIRVIDTDHEQAEISLTHITLSPERIPPRGAIRIYKQRTDATCEIRKY